MNLNSRQPDIISPPIAAAIVRTIDQQAAHTKGPHFGEGDFWGRLIRLASPIIPAIGRRGKPLGIGPSRRPLH